VLKKGDLLEIKRLVSLSLLTYHEAWALAPPSTELVIISDRFLRKVALEWIKKNPKEFLIVMYGNARELIFGTYEPLVYHELKKPLLVFTSMVRIMLYVFFMAGLVRVLSRSRFYLALLPLMIICYLIAIHTPMHTEPRYFVYSYVFMALVIPACLTRNYMERRMP
jgi:hypothetical protein